MDSRLCRSCEEPIPANRLKAKPGATKCVSCQELDDINSKPATITPGYHLSDLSLQFGASSLKTDEGRLHQTIYMKKMASRGYFQTAVQ